MATRDQILARYESQMKRIGDRRELSPQARNVALARAAKTARDALQNLADEQVTATQNRRQALERKLFGNGASTDGTTALSRRDAADRAALIEDPAEALAILKRSERAGDEDLARAVAAHAADLALEPKWAHVVDTYASTRPEAAKVLGELRELADFNNPVTKLQHVSQYMAPLPSEIGNLQPHQVDALAASDLLPPDPSDLDRFDDFQLTSTDDAA